jgi:hypothetical protein
VRPYVVTGPEGDFGEHLTGPDEALLATFVEAVRLPEGAP